MPRKRKPENRGLPTRWRRLRGKYYFDVPPGLEHAWDGKRLFPLGATLAEAHRTWADRIGDPIEAGSTVADMLDRYLAEVVPGKSVRTQEENRRAINRLRAVFGKLPLSDVVPRHVYQYVDKRDAKTAAHREIEVLSHAYTKAVSWGWLDRHPFRGEVRLDSESTGDRYVEDWEIVAALSLPSLRRSGSVLMMQAYIRIKLLTGLRRGDLLRLRTADLHDDGIHVQPQKTEKTTGARRIFTWSDGLRAAVDDALSVRPVDISPFLFCNRKGESYYNAETGRANGWESIWRRFMDRVLAETALAQRFTDLELRAKAGSDAESLERAQALLAHASSATTRKHYRRRPEVVAPGRGVNLPGNGGRK